jgi:hypothetical protein
VSENLPVLEDKPVEWWFRDETRHHRHRLIPVRDTQNQICVMPWLCTMHVTVFVSDARALLCVDAGV